MLEEGSAVDVALALGETPAAEAIADTLDADALDMEADADDAMFAAMAAASTEGDGAAEDDDDDEPEIFIIDIDEAEDTLEELGVFPTTSTLRPVAEGDPEVLVSVEDEEPVWKTVTVRVMVIADEVVSCESSGVSLTSAVAILSAGSQINVTF